MATRRKFVIGSGALAGILLAPHAALANTVRHLRILSLHTGETASVDYRIDGEMQRDALRALDSALRDHRTGETIEMDRRLFDLMRSLSQMLDTDAPFHIISGYRSPRTNAMLAGKSAGVARHSFHQWGMAVDLRLPGRSLDQLHRAARSLQAGGVGIYRRSNFIHIDTGRVRYWRQS
jgi:uncharacterized protein YcbK (DUF882 family)